MIKNGRPYTVNDSGTNDDGLITKEGRFTNEELITIGNWIKDNIMPSEVLYHGTSYGLKHRLEHDTKIYMTNNEFKDAMWLAGYFPVDADELNWEYYIQVKEDTIINPNPFMFWARSVKNLLPEKYGTFFVESMLHDNNFPVFANYDIIRKYLDDCNATKEVIADFEQMWSEYMVYFKDSYLDDLCDVDDEDEED